MADESTSSYTVGIEFDDEVFLAIPAADSVGLAEWAQETAEDSPREDGFDVDVDEIAASLMTTAEFADEEAVINLIYAPNGLPGGAVVSVYVQPTDDTTLGEEVDEPEEGTTQQVLPFGDKPSNIARIVRVESSQADGTTMGLLQLQLLSDGAYVETIVAAPDLDELDSGIPAFEDLTQSVTVTEIDEEVEQD